MSKYVGHFASKAYDDNNDRTLNPHLASSASEKPQKQEINAASFASTMQQKEKREKNDEKTDIEGENIKGDIEKIICSFENENKYAEDDKTANLSGDEEKNKTETAKDRKNELYLYVQTVLEAIVSAFLILTFFVNISIVIGSSMEPTLTENDRLVIMRSFYKPSYGDIIAVWAEGLPNRETGEKGEMIVKRVIGLEGDVIDIDRETGTVYRNGTALKENYIKESINSSNLGNANYPLTVAENSVFVLGDNRNHSTDSRYVENADTDYYVGCIDMRYIMGKAVFRIYPIDRIGVL